jgi:Bardet-Biedl syndrome 2 protein
MLLLLVLLPADKVLSGRAALGRFDGSTTSVAYATAAGKVVLHNPHDNSSGEQPRLNINKQVTVLGAGPLLPNSLRDVLLVGTSTCLHCYDVKHNRDVFYKDVPDGVACMAVGSYGSQHSMVAVVGGAGSLAAYDSSGAEVLWKAGSGSITALALADVDEDGSNELLVGSDDATIRIYKDDELLQQYTEADAVVQLAGLGQGRKWAYALQNGTIGVYESGVRLWRVKSKHSATSLCAFDLGVGPSSSAANSGNSSGALPHLISGWSSGRIEARSATSGEVVARDGLSSGIAALLRGQLRETDGGEQELVAVSTDGELRGYLPHHEELVADAGGDVSMQQRMLIDLAQKKQQLVYELASYQAAAGTPGSGPAAGAAAGGAGGLAAGISALGRDLSNLTAGGVVAGLAGAAGGQALASGGGAAGADRGHLAAMIPPDTRVDSAITVNKASQVCELVLKTNNSTVIHAALIFGEQVSMLGVAPVCLPRTQHCLLPTVEPAAV